MTVRIGRAEPGDAAVVHRVMHEAFAEYQSVLRPPSGAHRETVADVERALSQGGGMLAWLGTDAVASARFRAESDHLYVGRVAVLPSHRRRGIASTLMMYAEEIAVEAGLARIQVGVRMSLPGNVALYKSLGYELIAVEPHPKGPDLIGTLVKPVGD